MAYSLHFLKNTKKSATRDAIIFIGILLVLFLISKFSLNLPLLAIGVFLAYKICRIVLSAKIVDTKLFLTAVSIFFYVLILQSTSLVTWLISHNFPLSLNILVSVIILLCVYLPLTKILIQPELKKIKVGDVVSLLVTALTLVVFVILPVQNTRLHDQAGLLVLANYNVDDGSHLGLLNARLNYNVATTDSNKADISSQTQGGISYPTGWPAANAAVIQAINPSIKVGTATLIAYILVKIFWLLFLVFIFTRSIFTLFRLFSDKPMGVAATTWTALGSFLFTAWFLVDPFFYGFFSFLPQLITVPLFVLSLVQLASIEKKSNAFLSHLMLPSILCIGAALSWFLLFPFFILTLLLCLLNRSMRIGLKTVLKEITSQPLYSLVFYTIIILSLLTQLYIVLHSTHTGASSSFLNSLMLNGGINTYPISFYTLVLLGVILFFIFATIKKSYKELEAILNYIVAMIAFAGFVYAIQLYKLNENLYYYFKILNTVSIVGIIFAIVGIGMLMNLLQSKTTKYAAIISCSIVALIALQFTYPGSPLFVYAKGTRAVSPAVDQQIYSALKDETATAYTDGSVAIFYPSNNPILNEVASTLLLSGKSYTKCYATIKAASFAVPIKNFSTKPILEGCSKSDHITYYTDPAAVTSMRETISKDNLSSQVTVLPIAN